MILCDAVVRTQALVSMTLHLRFSFMQVNGHGHAILIHYDTI